VGNGVGGVGCGVGKSVGGAKGARVGKFVGCGGATGVGLGVGAPHIPSTGLHDASANHVPSSNDSQDALVLSDPEQ